MRHDGAMRVTFAGLLLCAAAALSSCDSAPARLRLATTTSTRDSGLLDALVPAFERMAGVRVDVIAVGTGEALALGEAGDVDVVLVHARAAEDAFMAAGHGVRREDVMYNTFELLGPPDDPAGVRGLEVTAALRKIAAAKSPFVSRGDDSGTHKRELSLWREIGGREAWDGYLESGQGMGSSLVIASERRAYVLSDRGTYLAFRQRVALVPLAARSERMRNPYGVITVKDARNPGGADAFLDFLVSRRGRSLIANFQVAGEKLFYPADR